MAKFTLQVDDLAVESFPTADVATDRGTVLAAASGIECPDTRYDPACCSTHETACENATCVVMSQCCQSVESPTCYFTCMQGCTGGKSAYCYHTEVC